MNENEMIKTLKKDPIMRDLISRFGEVKLKESGDFFDDLISSIVGQLLSSKAADTIYKRIAALCKKENPISSRIIKSGADLPLGTNGITPEAILSLSDDDLRRAGSSYTKIHCMKSLASAVMNKSIDLENIKNCPDEEVVQKLTAIKGIGQWTAEMFLIFSLAREDIFSYGDGGLNSTINRLYGGETPLTKSQIREITDRWQPYRSYASLYLWKSLDNK